MILSTGELSRTQTTKLKTSDFGAAWERTTRNELPLDSGLWLGAVARIRLALLLPFPRDPSPVVPKAFPAYFALSQSAVLPVWDLLRRNWSPRREAPRLCSSFVASVPNRISHKPMISKKEKNQNFCPGGLNPFPPLCSPSPHAVVMSASVPRQARSQSRPPPAMLR